MRRVSDQLYLVVGNPTAQSGGAKAHLERAVDGLKQRGVRAELLASEPQGRTVALVKNAVERKKPRVVVYLGGDGTFNEVARGILAASEPVPLGMLPMGTANDQGRSLGVRPGADAIEDNLEIILAGHVTDLDAGHAEALDAYGRKVSEALFFDSIGWGVSPEILARRNKDRSDVQQIPFLREVYRDQAVYAGALLERFVASFIEPTKFAAQIVCDGRTIEYSGLTDVIISATAIYAGEWVLDRFSEPDDGLFELVPMQGRRDWASKALRDLAILPLFQEDLDVIGVTHSDGVRGARFELTFLHEGDRAISSQLDGEEWIPGNRYRVSVLKNALPVITPEKFVPPWRFDRAPTH